MSELVTRRRMTPAGLMKAALDAADPRSFIQQLPAQSLYLGLRGRGLAGSIEIIELMTVEQCRTALDFDLWSKDDVEERSLWEWLEVSSERPGFELFSKIVRSLDLKIVALLISRHVDVHVFEEPTDAPPGPKYYTPDKGYTWLGIKLEDAREHFLMGQLLAYLFEADQGAFYQIVSAAGFETPSSLTEQAYQDKTRRLLDEGLPDDERARELNSPLSQAQFAALVRAEESARFVPAVPIVDPLVQISLDSEPLRGFLETCRNPDEVQRELTLLLNAALVAFAVPSFELEAVGEMVQKVKGCLNIGMECAVTSIGLDLQSAYESAGLISLYRLGLSHLHAIRLEATKLLKSVPEGADSTKLAILEGAAKSFPEMPLFMRRDGSFESEQGRLIPGFRALSSLADVQNVTAQLREKTVRS